MVEYQITINQKGLKLRENPSCGMREIKQNVISNHGSNTVRFKAYHQTFVHVENISFHHSERIITIVGKMWGLCSNEMEREGFRAHGEGLINQSLWQFPTAIH